MTSRVLTRETVVDAAVQLLERDGSDRFSVRALADSLGVAPAAVRWHAGSRELLLLLAVDAVLTSASEADDAGLAWPDRVRLLASRLRTALLAHPQTALVARDRLFWAPSAGRVNDVLLTILTDAGFNDEQRLHAHNSLLLFVLGATWVEIAQATASQSPIAEVAASLPAAYTSIAAQELGRRLAQWQSPPETTVLDESFRLGLEALLTGLPAPARAAPAASVTR